MIKESVHQRGSNPQCVCTQEQNFRIQNQKLTEMEKRQIQLKLKTSKLLSVIDSINREKISKDVEEMYNTPTKI